jgi:hypothetical protein
VAALHLLRAVIDQIQLHYGDVAAVAELQICNFKQGRFFT